MNIYNNIEELLDKYWECNTSVEEEEMLQDFFLHEKNIPTHLCRYKAVFAYREMKQTEKLPDNFEEKILAQIHHQLGKKVWTVFKIAACIALLISTSITAYQYKTASDYEKQAQARATVIDALCMISDNLQKGENIINNGLKQFDIVSEINH